MVETELKSMKQIKGLRRQYYKFCDLFIAFVHLALLYAFISATITVQPNKRGMF